MRKKLTQFISNPLGQALGSGGFSAQRQSTEDGWDSRPYLVTFLVRYSIFPRLAKRVDSQACPSSLLGCRSERLFVFVVEERWKVALGGPDRDTTFAIEEEAADVTGQA